MDDSIGYEVEQELVAVIPSQQNFKGIGISLLVILSVIGLVALSVWFMTPPDTGPRIKGARISLENFTGGIFLTNNLNTTWYSDSELALIDSFGNLVVYHTITGARRPLISANIFRSLNSAEYSLSPERSWVLVRHQVHHTVFNTAAFYSIQNIHQGSTSPLVKVGVTTQTAWDSQEELQHVEWAGRPGGVVIVRKNDIYFRPDPLEMRVVRITDSGVPGVVFNGVPDWSYKNILSSCLEVSPDHASLLYTSINSSLLPELRFPQLIQPSESSNQHSFIKFPTVLSRIPEIHLYHFNLWTRERTEVLPPLPLHNRTYYIESISWLTGVSWTVAWASREQDVRITTLCRTNQSDCTQILYERASSVGLETLFHNQHPPLVHRNESSLAYIGLKMEGDQGLYPHLHIRRIEGGAPGPSILTHGAWRVKQLISWDFDSNIIYFLGSAMDQRDTQHLYRVLVDGDPFNSTSCISCSSDCQFTVPVFSPDSSMYIQHCLGPSVPYSQVISSRSGELVKVLDLNSNLQDTLQKFSFAQTKLITVDSGNDRHLRVQLKLPPGFREYEEYAFPLILYIDSLSPSLPSTWGVGWTDYLASHKDYIIAQVDLGGPQCRNESRLGLLAQQEILLVLRYLTSLKYVDKSKVGLVGKGEGGYMAGMVFSDDIESSSPDNSVTKCAIFISPTVDWRLTEAFTGENLLGLGKKMENWNRYELSSLASRAVLYPSSRLYLTNTPGDLVNLNHLFEYSRNLVNLGIIFKQQVYLDTKSDTNSMFHFYKSMEFHLDKCLGPVEDFFKDDYFLATLSSI